MIFYDTPSPAPNPRRVRIFAAEKGLDLHTETVSLLAREHKSAEHLARNPLGQVPVLVLDDGTAISETVAICRYLEALHASEDSGPPLFGQTALEIATIEMWIRRVEFVLGAPVKAYWVNVHPYTAAVVPVRFEDYGKAAVPQAMAAMAVFDAALAKTQFIAGDTFTMADIVLLSTVDFASFIGLTMPQDCTNLLRWHAEVTARPSAAA